MFYAEIDENKRCFHVTDNPLPLGDTIIAVESNDVLGKVWNGKEFVEDVSGSENI